MHLEIINTGTELLLGNTLNTHLAYLGENLLPLGLRVDRQLCIPDGDIIRTALLETVGRADIVIVTGGLGPTSDDITREITAGLLGLPLVENAEVFDRIQERLRRRHREMNTNTRRQAMVPSGSIVLHNDHGTAPGLYFPPLPMPENPAVTSPHIFLLPGPPRELKPMFTDAVEPLLRSICAGRTKLAQMRNFHICGLGESEVARTVETALLALGDDIEIGYCARLSEVIVRVIGNAEQLEAARMIIAASFPMRFFAENEQTMEETVVELLKKFGRTVATAESCTGGMIANRITNVPGASSVLNEAYVTYANDAKISLLGVPPALLAEHGAVSHEVCEAMAKGCLERTGATYALSATGIAGPDGGSEEKPVGTVFIGVAAHDNHPPTVEKHFLNLDRLSFKQAASILALDLLRRRLVHPQSTVG
jgi:nicotinamide-nucleotide amidase